MPTRNEKGQFVPGVSGNPGGVPREVGVPRERADAAPETTAVVLKEPEFLAQFRPAGAESFPRRDGWMSAITGIGDVTRDKRTTHSLAPIQMSYAMIAQLWAKEAMCAKAIEKPGEECFRPCEGRGFELDIPGEQTGGGKGGDGKGDKGDAFTDLKEYVTDQLRKLDAIAKLKKAYQYKRAYGGGALLLGINDNRSLDLPVDTSKNPSLDWINVLEPIEIYPISFYDDPAEANYGEPEFYQLGAYAALPQFIGPIQEPKLNVIIHESRIIPFRGIKVSRYFFDNTVIDPYWGASILPRFYDAMRDCAVAYQGAGLLSVDVSQPVITIEGLRALVGRNEEALRARMIALEQGRSIARAILLDGKEKYERQTTQLAGIPDLLDRCAQFLAANIDIPLSILFGYSPASLGTPDNQELTQWYNLCRVIQTQEFTPPLRRIIDLIMRGRRSRGLPKRYDIAWGDLEHMTTTQRVQNEFTQARTDSLNVKSGTIYPDEIRKSRWVGGHSFTTQIDEKKDAPGFIAPLPDGVLAKPMTAKSVTTAIEAGETPGATGATPANGNAPATPGAGAHTVGGYTRRNPVRVGGEKQPGTGSAPEARASKADEAPGIAAPSITAADEVQHLQDRLARHRSEGTASPGVEALLQKLIVLTQADAEQCAAGTCGPDCIYSHEAMDAAAGETIMYAGFPVLVENPKGSVRQWVDSDGTTGSTTMKWDYGEIPGSLGTDGDPVDVYLGPDPESKWVFVVHQMSKATGFTTADEDKVMLGWNTAAAATRAYLSQYDDDRFFGGMSQMTVDDFRTKVLTGAGTRIANDASPAAPSDPDADLRELEEPEAYEPEPGSKG